MAAFVRPKWEKPTPIGYGPATESVSGVAAPLLAGFCLAATIGIGQDADKFRWPGAAMVAFTMGAIALVFSLQCGFTARQYLYSAAELRDWWPDLEEDSDRELKLRQRQRADYRRWTFWSTWTRRAHNAGFLFLLAGLSLALAPPSGDGRQETLRWVGTALAGLGAVAESAWIIGMTTSRRKR